jgi:hypothetical protein
MTNETNDNETKKIPAFARMDRDPNTITLADASAWVKANMKRGAICPCCDQLARRYQRKLSSSMAAALILIRQAFRSQTDWLHVPEYLTQVAERGAIVRGGDWAKLIHWRLLEAKQDEVRKDGSRRVGFYRITQHGVDFVERRVTVPKYAYIYAQHLIGLSDKTTTIDEALRDRFNYSQLMAT